MIVKQIWTANRYRNFNYLIACEETGEALAIDPLDSAQCLAVAHDAGFEITQVLNTHEHHDHIGGNQAIVEATGAKVLAHHQAHDKIPGVDRGLAAGDVVRVGKTVELEVLDTPGHTMCHLCLRAHGDQPAIFTGDTLFNAGAGNCHNGGDPQRLFETFATQLESLDAATQIFPGHDYLANNLRFTLAREPDNADAQAMLERYADQDPAQAHVTTMAQERRVNTFFRLRSPSVIEALREAFPDLPANPDPRTVFLKLRELRNHW